MELRRRSLIQNSATQDLYPIGTDILLKYDMISTSAQNSKIDVNTGDIVSGDNYVSVNYAEIDPFYTYTKGRARFYQLAYYDRDKTFIVSTNAYGNLGEMVITNMPFNARYIRLQFVSPAATGLTLTRTI